MLCALTRALLRGEGLRSVARTFVRGRFVHLHAQHPHVRIRNRVRVHLWARRRGCVVLIA
eukprot:648990-Pleurochrysis_carterae.AAC.1